MNKVILMGRLTQDPELRQTTTNKSVCSFRLAVNKRFAKQNEENNADFFPIVAWEKTADFCNNYFRKGQQVAVIGRLQNRSWDDADGKKHYITEIVADEVFFADSKKDSSTYAPSLFDIDSNPLENNNSFYSIAEDNELPF